MIADVAFVFQDMEQLKREESLTSDSSLVSGDMNQTQPCECVIFHTSGFVDFCFLSSPYGMGQTIIFLPCGFFLSSFFLA